MNQYLLSIMKGQRSGFFAQLITFLLLPWSLFYGLGVFCHRHYYQLTGRYKAPKPLISIGNITVGGSGKTPLVIWLARNLQDKGYKSVILIRGYMPQAAIKSDEVDMLNEQLPYVPVLSGKDRITNILKTKSKMPVDVFIADDAFQHWPLLRDLNIVAIDAGNPFGNGHLLPAGILREPLSSLKRAHIFVLTKTNASNNIEGLSSRLKRINPKALIVESRYKNAGTVDVFGTEVLPVDFLKDKRVTGFCAIGDPLSFESELKNTGAIIAKQFTYMDHHVYTKDDLGHMFAFCRSHDIKVLVTTHKDAVKLHPFKDLFTGIHVVYIPIQLEITKGSDEFIQKVITVCRH